MSDNPFHEAVQPKAQQAPCYAEPSKPFFHYAIEQDKLRQQARNMTRQQMFDNGLITVADLDDEELRYGKCRDGTGKVRKNRGKTEMVPRDLYDEMVLEHQKRTDEKLRQQLDTMLEVMVEVATDDTVEPRERLDAAKYLFERVAGKTAERLAVTVDKAPWEEVFSGVAKISRQRSHALREGAIDAEVVEDVRVGTDNDLVEGSEPDDWDGRREYGRGPTVPPSEFLLAHKEDGPFTPAPSAPDFAKPVSSSSVIPSQRAEPTTTSEALREMQSDAKAFAVRKAQARKRIQDAKKRRAIQRAMGAKHLRGNEIQADIEDDKIRFSIASDEHP